MDTYRREEHAHSPEAVPGPQVAHYSTGRLTPAGHGGGLVAGAVAGGPALARPAAGAGTAAADGHRQPAPGLRFSLPPGVVHGDASVGTVIHDRNGRPVLIDLDGFAIGPREWDLVLTAIYYDSFGWHTAAEYAAFAEVYGFDVMGWPGYPVLRDVREFLMVTWLSQQAGDNKEAAAEVRKRITALRTGGSKRDWRPY